MIKILFITHYGDLYGANLSLLYLIKQLKKEYGIIPIVLTNKYGGFTHELNKMGIPVIKGCYLTNTINSKRIFPIVRILVKNILNYILYSLILFKVNKLDDVNFIHTNSSIIDVGDFLAHKLEIPHIWHFREFGMDDYNLKSILSIKSKIKKYKRTNRIIAISKSMEDFVLSINSNLKPSMIPNGIEIIEDYEKQYFKENKTNFCILGSIRESKGQMDAVKACVVLKQKGYYHFKLYIVGSGNREYIGIITKIIEENNLKENIQILEYQKDIHSILKMMDIGIMSSKKEAFGRVTIEYMSHYMPVIGTNRGATPELVHHGVSGFLYNSDELEELVQCMERFLRESDLVTEMGRNARNESKNFSDKKNAEKIYSLYREVLNGLK